MIDVTMEEFILWLVCVPITMVGVFSILSRLKRRSAVSAAQRHIVTCRVCGHLYQDRSRERDPVCPECGRANERGRSRRLG